MLTQIQGFSPDVDPVQPGVLTACVSYIPSFKGMKAAPSAVSASVSALASACHGAAVLLKLDTTRRLVAGALTKLYEISGAVWSDVSRTSGGAYNTGAEYAWRFAQYGDVSLAAQKGDKIQFSNGSGAFENITAAPKASIIEVVGNFVFAFDYNDGTDRPAGWINCALGDYTNWTPGVAVNSYAGTLQSTPGPILAGRRLADGVVAYKLNAMYLGIFQGPPIGWSWQEVSDTAGALSQEVVVPITTPQGGQAHIVMGSDDFYYYDGSRPVRIGTPLKDWVFGRLNRTYSYKCIAVHDPINALIYFYYVSTASGGSALDSCVVYNYRANRWGVDDRNIEAAVQYVSASQTYDAYSAAYATYDDVPASSYGSSFLASTIPTAAVFNTSHQLQTLNGVAGSCSFTTGDVGDDDFFSTLMRVRPRWVTRPTTATMTNYYRNELGDTLTTDGTISMSGSHFDCLREARWHRATITTVGDSELTALNANIGGGGGE